MKRLLLISYVFPPEPSAGALRPAYLARYLPQNDWDVTVLTHSEGPPPFAARMVSVPALGAARLERRVPFRVRDALMLPDATLPWVPRAVAAGVRLLRTQRFDAILGTALPATVHIICGILARTRPIPWIADYRDPWTGNAYANRGPLRRRAEAALERGLLRRADAITTISPQIAQQLRTLHRREDVFVIPNAYDPSEWESIQARPPAHFDLVYTGSLYDGKRSPDLLFAALKSLRDEHDPIGRLARVHFYGPNSGTVSSAAQAFGLTLSVRRHGVVDRVRALEAQRGAAALLIFLNMDSATAGEMGSKFLEYIGARRPIIAFGPPQSVMREFIRRERLGWFASNLEQARQALRMAHTHFAAGSPDLTVDSRSFPTAPELARRFARRLDAVSAGKTSTRTFIMEAS